MLAMPKFTSGKWKVEMVYGDYPIVTADGRIVADCFNNEANARLIAAAPEMYVELYEALQLCAGHSSYDGDDFSEQAKSIRELLARMDGEEADA